MLVIAICGLIGAALVFVVIWPVTDVIAAHDVGRITASQRQAQMQSAHEAVRTQLLTLGAGLFAAAALIYTGRNFTLSRKQFELAQQSAQENADAQRRTLELTEQSQVTDRYTRAIEQLGSQELDVRIGGIYALERIARDSARDHTTIIEVLSAFVRVHSHEQWLPAAVDVAPPTQMTRPDVQAAMTVIGRRSAERDVQPCDLTGVRLPNANLTAARLDSAFLTGAVLHGANLSRAKLRGAVLQSAAPSAAFLNYADLADAKLFGAKLTSAVLDNAVLSNADLREADLAKAKLASAKLCNADLRQADFTSAYLGGADLTGADLAAADLTHAHLREATVVGARLIGASLDHASWPANADVPVGWVRKPDWGELILAGTEPEAHGSSDPSVAEPHP